MILLLFIKSLAFQLDEGSMKGYLTLQEIHNFIDYHLESFPKLSELAYFGQSSQIRDIRGIKLTNSEYVGEKTSVVISASQTSGYPISTSAALYSLWNILNNSDSAFFSYLLKTREIYILPLMNPDAYALTEKYFKRGQGFLHYSTNRNSTGCMSLEGNGVMLNRNWGYKWNSTGDSSSNPCSDTYPGYSPFSEVETRSVQNYFNHSKILTWLHYEGIGNTYITPFTYQKKQNSSSQTSYAYSTIQQKMQEDWSLDSLYKISKTTEDGTLIDYYQSLGTLALQGSIGSHLPNQSEILNVLEEHFQVALSMIELSGSYLNYIDFHSKYQDCNKKCEKEKSKAYFDFLFENSGLSDSPSGILTIVVSSEFLFEEIIKISKCTVEFQEVFDGGKTGVVVMQDGLMRSDTVFYVERMVVPGLTRAKFVVEIDINGTHQNGVDILASLKYEFEDNIHPEFSVNGILRKSEISEKEDKSYLLPVILSISLGLVVLVGSIVVYHKCKKRIYENPPQQDASFNKTGQI
jgi:hypothetical protein